MEQGRWNMELDKNLAKEIIMEQYRNLNQLNFRQHEEREEREMGWALV